MKGIFKVSNKVLEPFARSNYYTGYGAFQGLVRRHGYDSAKRVDDLHKSRDNTITMNLMRHHGKDIKKRVNPSKSDRTLGLDDWEKAYHNRALSGDEIFHKDEISDLKKVLEAKRNTAKQKADKSILLGKWWHNTNRKSHDAALDHLNKKFNKKAFFFGSRKMPYAQKVSKHSGIPYASAKQYVDNIRPHRFMIPAKEFAKDIKPVYDFKENKYRPLQNELMKHKEGSPGETEFLKKNKKKMDSLYGEWTRGQASLRKKYTGGDKVGYWADINKHLEKTHGEDWHSKPI